MRGMGRIFKRGSVYWIAYCYRGKEHRESSHSDSESQARKLLKRRLGETGTGRLVGPSEERLTFDDLAKMLLTDYEINGKRSETRFASRSSIYRVFWAGSRYRHYARSRERIRPRAAARKRC
jgi:hypothetical protein